MSVTLYDGLLCLSCHCCALIIIKRTCAAKRTILGHKGGFICTPLDPPLCAGKQGSPVFGLVFLKILDKLIPQQLAPLQAYIVPFPFPLPFKKGKFHTENVNWFSLSRNVLSDLTRVFFTNFVFRTYVATYIGVQIYTYNYIII